MRPNVRAGIIFLIFLSFWISYSEGQSFQYSRGWTNGKRSDIPPTVAKQSDQILNLDDATESYK